MGGRVGLVRWFGLGLVGRFGWYVGCGLVSVEFTYVVWWMLGGSQLEITVAPMYLTYTEPVKYVQRL